MAPKRGRPPGRKTGFAADPAGEGRRVSRRKSHRASRGDDLTSRIELVQAALRDKEQTLPGVNEEAREMLAAAAKHAFRGEAMERHKSQLAATKMIGELLAEIRKALERGRDEKQEAIEEANSKNAQLEAERDQAKQELEQKREEIHGKAAEKQSDERALAAQQQAHKRARAAEAELEGQKEAKAQEARRVKEMYEGTFQVLCYAPPARPQEAQQLVRRLQPELKKMNVDASLLKGAAPALLKPAASRGSFDQMTINCIGDFFQKALKDAEERVASHDTEAVAEAAAAKGAAEAAVEAATTKLADSTAALSGAEADRKEKEEKLRSLEHELKAHERSSRRGSSDLISAEAKVAAFADVEAAFAFLSNYASKEADDGTVEEEAPGTGSAASGSPPE